VHERKGRFDVPIHQIGKHRLDLIGDQHALVDQRVRRQARDIEILLVRDRNGKPVDSVLDPLANDVELAFERRAHVSTAEAPPDRFSQPDEYLLEVGLDRRG
jgi:hypothetical protein